MANALVEQSKAKQWQSIIKQIKEGVIMARKNKRLIGKFEAARNEKEMREAGKKLKEWLKERERQEGYAS